jgi:hypothetical protein
LTGPVSSSSVTKTVPLGGLLLLAGSLAFYRRTNSLTLK